MNPATAGRPIKYIATVNGVRDITLVGSANYAYWAERLVDVNLLPLDVNGRAEIWICADRLKWMGICFNELSVSLRIDAEGESVYLIAAFNSSRLFSFMERVFFRTPYRHAQIDVDSDAFQSFTLHDGNQVPVRASRASTTVTSSRDDSWEGRIFLPRQTTTSKNRHFFFAHLTGATDISPFNPLADKLTLNTAPQNPVVEQLINSHFRGIEWRIRRFAMHARSKTYSSE